jgi:hypothetical protein
MRDSTRGIRRAGRDRWHPTMGIGVVLEPDGTVAHMGEWEQNALLDEGEQDISGVYFLQNADLTKYLALLKGAQPADTDTMAFFAGATNGEIGAPPTGGYARQQVLSTDWGTPALNSGDYQTTAAQKTFGPNSSGATWPITSVSLCSAATGQLSTSGKHLINTPTSAQPTSIVVGQSFLWTQTAKAQ